MALAAFANVAHEPLTKYGPKPISVVQIVKEFLKLWPQVLSST